MPDYSIRLDLLTPGESRRLGELGVQLSRNAAIFSRQLTADETREVWHVLADLHSRTGDGDNHINFALGDWAVKAEEWFGEEQTYRWVEEYNYRKAFRDHLLGLAGATLVQIQSLEQLLRSCFKILGLHGRPGSLLSSDPKIRKRTLGQLIRALRDTRLFDEPFEDRLARFARDRNVFVHSFWRDLNSRYPGMNFRSQSALEDTEKHLLDLSQGSVEIERVFKGLYYAVGRSIAAKEGKLAEFAQIFPEWSAHEQRFQAVMRRQPPSPGGKSPRPT